MSIADEPDRERPPGAAETSLWCNRCMLPSACRFDLEVKTPLGPVHQELILCIDCGSQLDKNGNALGV